MESKRSQETKPVDVSPLGTSHPIPPTPKIFPENFENSLTERSFTNSFLQMDCAQCDVVEDLTDHSFDHAPDCPTRKTSYGSHVSSVVENAKRFQLQRLAGNIRTIKHFRRVVKSADPKLRKDVYNLIAPYILKFIPPTYRQLMGRSAREN